MNIYKAESNDIFFSKKGLISYFMVFANYFSVIVKW